MSWLPLAPWWVLFPLAALLLAAVAWPLHRRPEAPSPGRGALLRRSGILVLLLAERLQAARQAHPDRPRVVFYLGDGEQTAAAAPQPFSIPGNLINGGAVLGYGTVQGGRMLENFGYSSAQKPQYIKDTTTAGGGDAVSRIDEHMLSTIAADLDVPYVHRSAGDPVTQALQDARPGTVQLSSQAAAGSRFELYWILALAAFPLLVWELLIHGRRIASLRPVPEAAR
jgi:Ca-activated chloride channel family protein